MIDLNNLTGQEQNEFKKYLEETEKYILGKMKEIEESIKGKKPILIQGEGGLGLLYKLRAMYKNLQILKLKTFDYTVGSLKNSQKTDFAILLGSSLDENAMPWFEELEGNCKKDPSNPYLLCIDGDCWNKNEQYSNHPSELVKLAVDKELFGKKLPNNARVALFNIKVPEKAKNEFENINCYLPKLDDGLKKKLYPKSPDLEER